MSNCISVGLCLAIAYHLISLSQEHGLMIEPPARNAMWRFGFPTPPDYGENELFCGGLQVNVTFIS